MNRTILTLLSLLFCTFCYSQQSENRTLYIVDSVAIYNDPGNDANIKKEELDSIVVITNADRIKSLGYEGKFEKLILIFTKAYKTRSSEAKKIPTTKSMVRVDGRWRLIDADTPYSGQFIDYFMNGKIQGEGTLKDGLLDGSRTVYYANGNKEYNNHYRNGLPHGESKEYFGNGALRQQGSFEDNKEVGLWQIYYSNGKPKLEVNHLKGKQVFQKDVGKFLILLEQSIDLFRKGDLKTSIQKLDEAEKLNQNQAELYFYRGTAKLESMEFEGAILDFDKALLLEPLYKEVLSNRAFARIRKHEFKDGRVLSKNKEMTIVTTKTDLTIPDDELQKICADLKAAYELGDDNKMVVDAITKYCN
ncbi:MAG: hypothetical protein EOO92_07485 [Pedobacter sp.]|nr:MAG: hypothetical protein EOO92_07485 [Pedobacter sp.]